LAKKEATDCLGKRQNDVILLAS